MKLFRYAFLIVVLGLSSVRVFSANNGFEPPANPLCTGMTPANYIPITGWEPVRTQNFESGNVPSDEMVFGSITNARPHSGQRSLQGKVWKDDCATGWKLKQGVATTGDLYCSWYEYMEEQGRMNDEMWLMCIRKNWASSGMQSERWQWLNNIGNWNKAFNILDGNLIFFCEGNEPGTTGSVAYYGDAVWRSVGFGKWQQWEVYWKTNTPGIADGITQIYLDGVKITEVTNKMFSGTLDMTGPGITLGGTTYTKISWGPKPKPDLTCATTVEEITYSIQRPQDFSIPCLCPGQCPPDGYVPIFHRFVDDIIILQRSKAVKTVKGTSSVLSKVTFGREVRVYPSPAGGSRDLMIQADWGCMESMEIRIYDAVGRLVHSATLTGTPYTWTGSTALGLYYAFVNGKTIDGKTVRAKTRFTVVR